jgi:ribonuclease P protein component
MLPKAARLRSANEFRHAVREGVRAGRSTLVVHAAPGGQSSTGARVGFVVSKAVGPAVVRNRVKRRLRHLVRPYLLQTPAGVDVVVRALPRAATDPQHVPADLELAWRRAVGRMSQPDGPVKSDFS